MALDPARRAIVRNALAVAVAIAVFGFSFGVVASDAGLGVARTCALSLLVFAGGSQFAAVSVVASGGSPWTAVASGLLVNARLLAFGIAVAPVFRGSRKRRLLGSQLVVDEPVALALAEGDPELSRYAFWVTGGILYVLWNLATLAGATVGSALGDETSRLGLDGAFPAAFVALLAPRLRGVDGRVAAAAGVVVALTLVPLAPAGVPVMAAAVGVPVALLVRRRAAR